MIHVLMARFFLVFVDDRGDAPPPDELVDPPL